MSKSTSQLRWMRGLDENDDTDRDGKYESV